MGQFGKIQSLGWKLVWKFKMKVTGKQPEFFSGQNRFLGIGALW